MKCMRCGTGITSDQVFCDTCLEDMKRHPVDPATPVQLPQRSAAASPKASHRKIRKPEDQLTFMRRLVFWQFIVIFLLLISLVIAVIVVLQLLGVISLPLPLQMLQKWIPW